MLMRRPRSSVIRLRRLFLCYGLAILAIIAKKGVAALATANLFAACRVRYLERLLA
jgi:hypothetical protein